MKKILLFFLILFHFSIIAQNLSLEKISTQSDSLESLEKYSEAIKLWNDNASTSPLLAKLYKAYFQYWNDYENQSFNKLISIENELLKIQNRNSFQSELLIKIYTQHYHHIAENDTWVNALNKALEGYRLKDFNKGKSKTKTDYLYDLGYMYNQIGNYYEAINYYTKSLDLYRQQNGEIDNEVALNYNNLGFNYNLVYNKKQAIKCYEKAVSIWEKAYQNKADKNDYLISAYNNLNQQTIEYGDLNESVKIVNKLNKHFYRKYKLKKDRVNPRYFESRQLMILSNVNTNAALGKFDTAQKYCDSLKAETNLTDKKQVNFLLSNYTSLADYYYENKLYDKTIALCLMSNELAEKHDLQFHKMIINSKLGTTYEKLKNYKQGFYFVEKAVQFADNKSFNSSKFSIQIIKAINLEGLNETDKAIATVKNTIEQIVFEKTNKKVQIQSIKFEMINDLASEDFINIFSSSAKSYLKAFQKTRNKAHLTIAQNLFTIAAKLFQEYYLKGEFNDSLSYFHHQITEGLLECLLLKTSNFEDKIALLNLIEQNASQHLIKEFDKKLKRNNAKNNIYSIEINSLKNELEYYKKQAIKNENKIAELQNEIEKRILKISETEKNYEAFNSTQFNLKEVISKLSNKKQILKYFVCNTSVYGVLLSNNTIEIKKIGDKSNIERLVNYYRKQINNMDLNAKKTAGNLGTSLIPFSLQKSVTIIPDSFLNYLPFETLMNTKNNQYIVENHLISYDYSLPMWLLHKNNKSTNHQKLAAFSPLYSTSSINAKRSDFKELKFAKIESENIVALFNGTLFTNDKAKKENFIKNKQNFDIFHLSMHSQLFEDDFNKSCLVFSNEEKLYFSELYGMNIPASMVVLSACDTGNGALKNGEGIMSMSRALTYAGVKSAVVSLWQVPDKETSEIMISFYENLKKGQSKDEALANAKTIFIKNNPMKNHPFYWAGFVLNGDVSPINSNSNWMLYLGIGLAVLALTFLFRKKLF